MTSNPHLIIGRKSRAKSCTTCRQVKLRCDVREKHPAPCSRCQANGLECKMDANFKRVQVRKVRYDGFPKSPGGSSGKSGGQAITVPLRESRAPNELMVSYSGSHSQEQNVSMNPTKRALSLEKWLDLTLSPSESASSHWDIGSVRLEHDLVQDLFSHFATYYYPHLQILEPVKSLENLFDESPALFWSIIYTASLHCPNHPNIVSAVFEPFRNLLTGMLSRPIRTLKDLHALLVICHWPFAVQNQSEDPTWMYCGLAVNAALHMGLDKFEDEILFGHRRAQHSLASSDLRYRQMTWMKCFQISTQLSTWLGIPPHLSSAQYLHTIAVFCKEKSLPGEFVAMTEIQRQTALHAIALDDLSQNGVSLSLVNHLLKDMNNIASRFSNSWSASAEINLQAAILYLLAHCLVSIEKESSQPQNLDEGMIICYLLQRGHGAALRLLGVIQEQCVNYAERQGISAIMAIPKQHFRVTFFACVFLFKYLDYPHTPSADDIQAARKAVSSMHQLFNRLTDKSEFPRTAQSIEVLGRTIIPGQGKMVNNVKTRMGASLTYNVIWMAAKLRGRQYDPSYSVAASSTPRSSVSHVNPEISNVPIDTTHGAAQSEELAFTDLEVEQHFPWGVWDDDAYDAMNYSWDDQVFSGINNSTAPF